MKGIDIYNKLLTTEERFRFRRDSEVHYWDRPNMWVYLMNKEFDNPSVLISQGFSWGNSPEGITYWCRLTIDIDARVGRIVKYQLPAFKF